MISQLAISLVCASAAPVQLRGTAGPDPRPVVRIDARGVELGGESPELVGWDRIKRLEGEHEPEAVPFQPLIDSAWRARERLARGDLSGALPLLERIWSDLADAPGPTTRLVAEGLVRARLAAGDVSGAIEPAIIACALRRAGVAAAQISKMRSDFDEDSGLPLDLPPIMTEHESAQLFVHRPMPAWMSEYPEPRLIAEWYVYAARAASGTPPAVAPGADAADPPSVRFVADVVRAWASPDESTRTSARESLSREFQESSGTWREAWARLAIGISLSRSSDTAARTDALLHLLHLPARFRDTHPRMTAMALVEAARLMSEAGDHHGSAVLLAQLRELDPRHPALAATTSTVDRPTTQTQGGIP